MSGLICRAERIFISGKLYFHEIAHLTRPPYRRQWRSYAGASEKRRRCNKSDLTILLLSRAAHSFDEWRSNLFLNDVLSSLSSLPAMTVAILAQVTELSSHCNFTIAKSSVLLYQAKIETAANASQRFYYSRKKIAGGERAFFIPQYKERHW